MEQAKIDYEKDQKTTEDTPLEENTPAPLPMKSVEDFEKNYKKGKLILDASDFLLFSGTEKYSKKEVIIKEYKLEFVNKIKDHIELFALERSYFHDYNKNNFKYICKCINCYKTNEQIILVFEKFTTTLKNELLNKKVFKIEDILILIIKINELIKYFSKREIYEIVFSPETIGINKEDGDSGYTLAIFNLFPYQRLKQKTLLSEYKNKSFIYLSNDFPSDAFSNLNNYSRLTLFEDEVPKRMENTTYLNAFLWNLGVLMYELYFGVLPNLNKLDYLIKLDNSGAKEFSKILQKLLNSNLKDDEYFAEDEKINWEDYLRHKFFSILEPEKLLKNIFGANVQKSNQEVDLYKKEVDDHTLEILLKINFENLIVLNLADNFIEKFNFPDNSNALKSVKFLNLEENKLKEITKNFLKSLKEIEYLFLSYNQITSLKGFMNIDLNNLNYLSLSNNNILDISPLSEANLTNLNVLNLSSNKIFNISCLEKINSPFLEELYLNKNMISDIEIFQKTNFKELKILELKENNIQDIFGLTSANLHALEILNLSKNEIRNINVFASVPFEETLKELYLSDNKIKEFNLLHLKYFPSLSKISLSTNDNNINIFLQILSIKLRLYGYTLNNEINNSKSISLLIIPFNLVNNEEIRNTESFDYTNSFKIIASSETNKHDIINCLYKNILEMTDSEISQKKDLIFFEKYKLPFVNFSPKENELDNYLVLSYIDDNNIINYANEINTLYLVEQYNKLYKKDRYYKIPQYSNYKAKLSLLEEICPFKIKIKDNYYHRNKIDGKGSFLF